MKHKLAVLGNPIAHSRSPEIHKKFAEQHRLEVSCERILVPSKRFENHALEFFKSGGQGFNITAPCKQDAFLLSATCSKAAELAQAAVRRARPARAHDDRHRLSLLDAMRL